MLARPLAPALLLAALAALAGVAACGTGLYDAGGIPPLDGSGLTCDAGQVVCSSVCTTEDATHCGADCVECALTTTAPPNGQLACIASRCGYVCQDGHLRCDGGCCAATALAAGPAFTCALLDDGTVRCWGANEVGQLGDGTTLDRPAPAKVALSSGALAIGAGANHACAIYAGGAVTCWGANAAGQVTGSATSGPVFVPAATPVSAGATTVVAGESHTCALLASGAVLCWGSNASGQLGPGPGAPIASGATTLVAGARHACALVGGAVQCWGDDASGQLGGTPAAGIATPIPSGITLLAASTLQTCASIATSPGGNIDPVLQCWGAGLGAGFLPADPQPTPAIPMKDPTQSTVRFSLDGIAIGRAHACVQKAGEFVHCFGPDDSLGQLGASGVPAGSREEWLVTGNLSATALAAGRDHTCALLAPGRLRCWGANERGQLGDGTTVTPAPGTISIPSGR